MRVYKDIRLKNSTTWWYFTSFVVTRQSRNLFFFSKNLTQPDTADGRTDSFAFFWFLRTRGTRRNSRFLCKFIFFLRFVTNAFFRLNGNWAVCLPRRIIHGKLVFVTTNDRRQTTNVALASDSIVQVKVIFNSRFHSFSWPRVHDRRRKKKTAIPRQGSEFQSEPVFRWPVATSMNPCSQNIDMEEVPFLRISTFVLLSLPFSFPISLIVTMFVIEVPLPVLVFWEIELSPLGTMDGDVGIGWTFTGMFIMDCWK